MSPLQCGQISRGGKISVLQWGQISPTSAYRCFCNRQCRGTSIGCSPCFSFLDMRLPNRIYQKLSRWQKAASFFLKAL